MKDDYRTLADFAETKIKKWYEGFPSNDASSPSTLSELEIIELKAEAKKCLDSDTAAFNLKQSKTGKSDYSWMKTMLTKGTISDKVAAGVVLIQDNPKYNLARLANLISMVKVSKKKQCTMIIDTLQELFIADLLPPEQKLSSFELQPFALLNDKLYRDNPSKRRQLLAHWYFEDQLKQCYAQFIEALNSVGHDTLDANKEKAITAMYRLLARNAEQEAQLLERIVNKIGDPSSKVASKAIFCLGQLLHEHPNMKQVVLREVEKLLFRKNVTSKAQYYGICLLTQFLLDDESREVANNLIEVYFAFFRACLKKGEVDSRMMGALLMGVNRAYAFAQMDGGKLQEHVDTVYKVVHVGSFNVSLNALSLLHQVIGKDVKQSERFYCAFYKKLLDPQIGSTTHQAMFLSLLFKVLKKDFSITRSRAFIKRMLQIALYLPVGMLCAILYMISQIFKTRKGLTPAAAIRSDSALSKEDLQKQVKDDEENTLEFKENTIMLSNVEAKPLVESKDVCEEKVDAKQEEPKTYDPYHRNPLHSGANCTFYSELLPLASHFHPTVALFANTIIQGKPISYSGDPLQDFTLIRFLDRYVFKNPKKLDDQRTFTKADNPLAKRAIYVPRGIRAIPVNSATYLNESEDRIPADELFLWRFLKSRDVKPKREDDEGSDVESVNSEDFNALLDGLKKDDDFDDMDIAGDIRSSKKRKKKEKDEDDDDSDEEHSDTDADSPGESDDFDELSDDDDDDDLRELEDDDLDGIDDEDLSDMDFSDEDDAKVRSEASKAKKKSKKKGFDQDVFASAEEFAELLEEEGRSTLKLGGANALSNADKAAVKQLDWEDKRNRWIKGYKKSVGQKRKGFGAAAPRKGTKKFRR